MPKLLLGVKNRYVTPPVPETISIVDADDERVQVITTYGKVKSIGDNTGAQFGDNTTGTYSASPKQVGGASKTFCKITTAQGYSLSIDKNGRIWSWGTNLFGVLGTNDTVLKLTPTAISGGLKTFSEISAKTGHVLAIDKYGRAWAWGNGISGQLGNNSALCRSTAISVTGAIKTFCKISAGDNHSIAIDKNGRAWGWGSNGNGRLGNNSVTNVATPVSVLGAVKTFCQIATGTAYTSAIDKNGRAWGWGLNSLGQIGNNSTTSRLTPVSVLGAVKTFCKISSGGAHTLAIDKNGRGWAWGTNTVGQLGDNSLTQRNTPVSILGATKTFCQIFGGNEHSVALDKNNNLWGWGYSLFGELGTQVIVTVTPVSIRGNNKTFCTIGAYNGYGFGIDKNGRAWGWGTNGSGQLGDNTSVCKCTPVSVLGTVKTFCKISAGNGHSLAIDKNGRAWGWGVNTTGQIGDNSITAKCTPVSVLGGVKTFCQISTGGSNHSLAIDKNGRAWTWGDNTNGKLGDSSILSKRTPVSVVGAVKTFCQISGGLNHSVALDKNGRVWGWGLNSSGQIGDNTIISKNTPVSILGAVKTFCKISVGNSTNLAIDKNGRAWGWGSNVSGAIGDFSSTNRCTPVSVLGAVKTFCEISTSGTITLAIDKNGRLWSWGAGTKGALGNGLAVGRTTPVSILGAVKTFCKIQAGNAYAMAIDKNGKIWGWGDYANGRLGINQDFTRTPISISYF